MNPDDLLAYVDGELPPVERARVEREIELHPELLSDVGRLCRQRLLLAEAARAESSSEAGGAAGVALRPARRGLRIVACAAAACLVLAAGLLMLLGRSGTSPDRVDVPATIAANGSSGPALRGGSRVARERGGTPLAENDSFIHPRARDAGEDPVGPEIEVPEIPSPDPVSPAGAPAAAGNAVPDTSPAPARVPATPAAKAPPAPSPKPKAVPMPAVTTVALARVEAVNGKVQVFRGVDGKATGPSVRGGEILLGGDVVQVPAKGRLSVRYPDATRIEAGPETVFVLSTHTGDARNLEDGAGIAKKIFVRSGTVAVEAVRQPEGLPLLLITPEAEVRVLGTRFTLASDGTESRVEVLEGRVRMTRREDGALVEVTAGQFARAAQGVPLAARPLRASAGLVALYRFDEGRGAGSVDLSGFGDPLPLRIENPSGVSWLPGGILVRSPSILATPGAATKVIQSCLASRELTVEAWVKPLEIVPGGYVLALASNPFNINFALEQSGEAYVFHLRTSKTGESGVSVAARGAAAAGRLAHVVYTRAASGAGHLYVDAGLRAEHAVAGDLSRWDNSYRLAVAGDAKGKRPWAGEYRLVALYSRALSPAEIGQNFRAGSE